MTKLPTPPERIVLAHFIVSDDIERSRASTPKYAPAALTS